MHMSVAQVGRRRLQSLISIDQQNVDTILDSCGLLQLPSIHTNEGYAGLARQIPFPVASGQCVFVR